MFELIRKEGPFRHKNVRLYTWFSLFYNARAYYPIFPLLFFMLGLDVAQFFLLNMVWAATIFLLEVPSGAVADTIGRKRLIVFAAVLMVAEMALLLFAPQNGGWVLLAMCFVNRLLSGASEAAASGADQALAFDTLLEHDEDDQWDEVIATSMKWRSIGFFLAMITGALVADPRLLNGLLGLDLDSSTTLRIPVAIVFVQSLFCLGVALRMTEPHRESATCPDAPFGERCASATKLTLRTAMWVVKTPLAFRIVLGTLLIDAVVRNFVTIVPEFYGIIHFPVWSFGFIGAISALLGFVVPVIAKKLNQRFSPLTHLAIVAAIVLACLLALIPAIPWFILPVVILFTSFGWLEFISSTTLNKLADSSQRATVLSVKGLAWNLGYGMLALAYAGVLGHFEGVEGARDSALLRGLPWQAGWFALTIVLFFLTFWRRTPPPKAADEKNPS